MQNIALYIGNNASGKTRFIKSIIEAAKLDGKEVITNVKPYDLGSYVIDKNKYSLVGDVSNDLVRKILVENSVENLHEAYLSRLLNYIYARGDVLILDDLDCAMLNQEIIDISMVLSEVRQTWERIYVVGYNECLLRLFTTIDYENYSETFELNAYYIDDTKVIKLSEAGEVIECIDKIRG